MLKIMPKKSQKKDPKFSQLLGKGCAHVQNGIDEVVDWGFKKLKKIEKNPKKKDEHTLVKITRKIGGFIGDAGTEYYKEYKRIKSKSAPKQR